MKNAEKPLDYDMWDADDEINTHYTPMKNPLEFIRENVWGLYTNCDKKALQWQKS